MAAHGLASEERPTEQHGWRLIDRDWRGFDDADWSVFEFQYSPDVARGERNNNDGEVNSPSGWSSALTKSLRRESWMKGVLS